MVFNQGNPDLTLTVVPTGGRGSDEFGNTPDSFLSAYGLHGFWAPGNSGQAFVNDIASEAGSAEVGAVGPPLRHFLATGQRQMSFVHAARTSVVHGTTPPDWSPCGRPVTNRAAEERRVRVPLRYPGLSG